MAALPRAEEPGVRWVDPTTWHVTLRFLGEAEVDDVVRALLTAAYKALAADGVLVIAEPLADAPGAGPLIDAYFNVYLLAMGSGRPLPGPWQSIAGPTTPLP